MSLNNIIETFERPAEMASAFSSGAFAVVVVIVKDLIYLLARDFNCFIVSAGRISPRRLWPLTGKQKNIIIKYILKILKYCVTQLHKSPPSTSS